VLLTEPIGSQVQGTIAVPFTFAILITEPLLTSACDVMYVAFPVTFSPWLRIVAGVTSEFVVVL